MDISVGDRIRYESRGTITYGEVVRIVEDHDANKNLIEWVHIEYFNPKSPSLHSIERFSKVSLEQMNPKITSKAVIES